MITEKDLQEAIAECQGQRNPTASTCIKLAAFYIIKDHLFPDSDNSDDIKVSPVYSLAPSFPHSEEEGDQGKVTYYSDTEFGQAIQGMPQDKIWAIVDEAMSAVQLIQPRLYNSIIRKIGDA